MSRRRAQLIVAGGLALAVVHACIGWGVDVDQGCVVNADCENGFVCVDGGCRKVCSTSVDCQGSQACTDGVCMPLPGALCNEDDDCTAPGPCELLSGGTCLEGECAFVAAAVGASCDDGDPCTLLDVCDDARACAGTPRVCDDPPDDECTPDDQTFVSYPAIGTCHRPGGDCDYPATETACASCGITCLQQCAGVVCDETQGGCASNGVCIGGTPAECSYDHAADGTACDLVGDPVGSQNGLCSGGECVGCTGPEHCLTPPGEAQCYDVACSAGSCEYTLRDGQSCNDGDTCTYDDLCDGSGACAGTSISCVDGSGTCGVQRSCDGTNSCTEVWPDSSTGCDDSNACTYSDHCNGSGGCIGTPLTCSDDAGTCGANRSCNGTSTCAVSYPSGTTCDDGDTCTHTDRCNGSGGCVGTPITCTDDASTCGANRSCDGSATCAVSYPGTSTGCSDGNACTTGDHCNGGGTCVSSTNAADGTQCGTSWVRCCSGVCIDLAGNDSHCGGCAVDCASEGLSCNNTGTGGYACATCSYNSTCVAIYDSGATCWAISIGGQGFCQCDCPAAGTGYEVCSNGGCGANMYCYDCPGDNFCSPGGTVGACP